MLEVPRKEGESSLREQLEHVEKQTGHRDALLDSVNVPEGFEYLFRLFFEIRSGASDGMNGTRITWRDLCAFQEITGVSLDAFEADAVMAMDGEMARYFSERK